MPVARHCAGPVGGVALNVESSDDPSVSYARRYWIGVVLVVSYIPTLVYAASVHGLIWAVLIFVMVSAVLMNLRCPTCAEPMFKRGVFWVPWPSRTCPRCSKNVTVSRVDA